MTALAKFQQECPTIPKTTEGYGYKYADLPSILETIKPLLDKNNLCLSQPLISEDGITCVETILYHLTSGEHLEWKLEIPRVTLGKMNDYQSFGSGITYFRRYALSSALGIVTDEDTDAAGEQNNHKYEKAVIDRVVKNLEKELPWMTQKQFESSVKRIQEAKPNVIIHEDGNELELTPTEFVDKLSEQFRMKKDYKRDLLHEVEFQNTLNKVDDPKELNPEIPY